MRAKIVAIVNVTPDSFSDGGSSFSPADAIAHIERAIAGGADVIDIGAESTRPGAAPLTTDEEWSRLEPVLSNLPKSRHIEFSVDTRHAKTATNALIKGVNWINDVSGFCDDAMIDAVSGSNCKLVLMHSLSVPADKNIVLPDDVDVIDEIIRFAHARISHMEERGIDTSRIIFDPGIGFGKTTEQSQIIIDGITHFLQLGVPLLVGHSRKSFLGGGLQERDAATLKLSKTLAMQGVSYLRVHDVRAHFQMLEHLS